jgi:hypothetical protein
MMVNDNGPIVVSGDTTRWSDTEGEPQIAQLIERLDVKRIVVAPYSAT